MASDTSQNGQQVYYIGIAAVIVVLIGALWLLFKPDPAPVPAPKPVVVEQPVTEQQVIEEVAAEPEQLPQPEPQNTDTVEEQLTTQQPVKPLPGLNDADAEVKASLFSLNWKPGLASLFVTDDMIRKLVVQVDNIAQGQLVRGHNIMQPLPQKFVGGEQAPYQMDESNFSRYEPYLQLLESVPPQQLLEVMQRYEPLAQEAYAELGYPDASFRQRIIAAIDVLLATPEVEYPVKLKRPSVMYTFADPELEELPAAQKQLIRLGPDNQQRVKQLLRAYRKALSQ